MPLVVDSTVIERISGPISLHVCKVKPGNSTTIASTFGRQKRLPLVLLFGDDHNGADFECRKCHGTSCVHNYKDNFVSLINERIASKFNTQIFVETWNSINSELKTKDKNSLLEEVSAKKALITDKTNPMNKLELSYFGCFANRKDISNKLYRKICSSRNIKWKLGDPRNAKGNYIEYLLAHFFDDNLLGFVFCRPFTADQKELKASFDTRLKTMIRENFQDDISYFCLVCKLLYAIYDNDTKMFIDTFLTVNSSWIKQNTNEKNLREYLTSTLQQYQLKTSFTNSLDEQRKNLNKKLSADEESMCQGKVHEKLTSCRQYISILLNRLCVYVQKESFSDKYFRSMLLTHLVGIYKQIDTTEMLLDPSVPSSFYIQNYLLLKDIDKYESKYNFYMFHMHYTSFLLDTYLVASVIEEESDILIAYVGYYHINSISSSLASLLHYEVNKEFVEPKLNSNEQYRCLDLSNINLDLLQFLSSTS